MHARFRQLVILATVAISLFYLSYRIGFTLNLTTTFSSVISIALILAEAFGIASVVLFALQVWDPREPAQKPVLPGRTVDVFVPTYNEDPAILRATLEACTRLDYPGVRIYLCDDGGTDQRTSDPEKGAAARERAAQLKAICEELGVHYRTRPKNVHAKAGNLNYAFADTDGEFIIIFDADHAPEPHFVSRLIGYFADEKLGYIQTPHAFYNFDSFQSRLDHKNRRYWEEGALFYGVIQPGRNRWDCPIFAGSAAMFRRKALEEVGYIALETITEDMHTGMRMNAKGWKALGISERMIVGQAAPDITTFHTQRLRWGEGNLSIIFYDNPITMKGLSLAQRFCYLGSMIHWAGGIFKLIIYLTPILMMLTGISPVREFTWSLFTITAIYILVSLYGVKYASNGYGSIIYGELYAMVNFWTQIRGTMRAVFWRKFQQFIVTSKRGRQSNSIWPFVRPQIIIFALSFIALTWGWGRVFVGISDDYFKPMIPTVWLLFHMTLVVMTVRRALTPESGRYSFRHAVNVVVHYHPADGAVGPSGYGVTADLNETGIGFISYQEIPRGTRLAFEIAGAAETIHCRGTVVWTSPAGRDVEYGTGSYRIGVKFDELDGKTFDAVNRITLQYGVPRLYMEYAAGNKHGFMMRTAAGAYRRLRRFRIDPQRSYRLPVRVTLPGGRGAVTVTEELTATRIAVLVPLTAEVGDEIGLELFTPVGTVHGRGRVDKVRHERIGARSYHWLGVHFEHLDGDGPNEVQELISPRVARQLDAALRPEPVPMRVPIRRPVGYAVAAAALLLAIQFLSFPVVYSTEIFLRDVAQSTRPLTEEERARFDGIYQKTIEEEYPSTDRLVLLMACLPKVNPGDAGDAITVMLAKRDRDNFDLQKAWADVLLKRQDYAAAEARYQQLLALQDQGALTVSEYRELLIASARSAVHARDTALADKRFREYLGQYPEDMEARNEYAGFLLSQKRYAAVPPLYSHHTPDYDGQLLLMSSYALAGDFEAAEAESRTVLAKHPGDTKAEKLLADILNQRKSTIQAQAIYERLIAQAGTDPSVHVRLGQVYLLQHNFASALDQFQQSLSAGVKGSEVDHGYIDAAAGIVTDELTPKVKETADQIYTRVQTESVEDPVYLARLAWVMERFKQFEQSAILLERAAALNPTDVGLQRQLFGLLVAQGKTNEALASVRGDRNDPEIRRLLIDGYLRAGDLPAAAREAAALHEAMPSDTDVTRLLADILSWTGQYTESLKLFDELRAKLSSDAEIPVRIAEVTLWSGESEKAVGLFEHLLKTRFDQPKLWDGFVDAAAGAKTLTRDQFKLAVRIARQPAVLDTKNPALLSRLAWVFVRDNQDNLAQPLLERVVALKPTQPKERRELAGILAAADRPKEALAMYEGIQPLTADDHLRLADIHAALKQFAEAETEVRAYLAENPASPKGERLLADILSWKPDYPAALDEFRHLLAVDPQNEELRIRYAETTLWSGDRSEALTLFSRLIDEAPDDHRVLAGFIDAASAAPQLTEGQKAQVQKIAKETNFAPKDAALLGRLAWVFHQAGMTTEAENAINRALALNPQDPEVRKQLGGVLAALGRYDASLQMFAGLALGPKDTLELANLYAATRNFSAAEKTIEEYLVDHPNDFSARLLLANVLSWGGEYDESLALFAELAAEKPNDKDLTARIAEVNVWAGRPDVALPTLTAALESYLDQPNLWPIYIEAAANAKTLTPAQQALAVRIYLHLDPAKWTDVGQLARLAKLLHRVGRTVDATEILDHAAALKTTDSAARRELAWALADTGRPKEAIALFDGIRLTVADRTTLAGLQAASGDYQEAAEQYRTLLAADPNNPDLMLDLAGTFVGAKQFSDAIKLYEQLLARSPDDLELTLRIGEALLAAQQPDQALPIFTRVLLKRFDDLEARSGFVNAAATAKIFTAEQGRLARRLAADSTLLKSTDPTFLSRLVWVLVRERIEGPINPLLDRAVALLSTDLATKREVAGVLAAAGRAEEALAIFGTDIENLEDRFELANIYASLKDFMPAIEQCRLILADQPDSRKAQRLLADLLSWSREFDESLIRFEKLQNEDPNNTELAIRIAETTLWAYRPQEALALFTRILRNDPDQPKAVPGFVSAAFESSFVPTDSMQVADSVRQILTASKEEVLAPASLGGSMVAGAMIAQETDPLTLARLAYVFHRAGQTTDADRLFTRAVAAIAPEQTATRSEVGTILTIAGHTEDARSLLEGLPFNAEDQYRAARIYAAVKEFPECIRICRGIVALEPGNRKAERLLADALTWNEDYDEGLALLRKLLRETPDDPELPARIAQTLVWADRPTEALPIYTAELRKYPQSAKLVRGLFEAAAAAGGLTPEQGELVVKLYEESPIVREISEPVFLAQLGRTLQLAGRKTEASASLDRAAAANPQDANERRQLAVILAEAGRSDRALQLLSGKASDPADFLQLAYLLSNKNDFAAAEKAAREYMLARPNDSKAERLLADVLSWKGEYPESLKLWRKLQEQDPKDPTIPVRIAEVTLWSRDFAAAAQQFEKLLAEGSRDDRVIAGFASAVAALPQASPAYLDRVESLLTHMTPEEAEANPLTAGRLAVALMRGKRPSVSRTLTAAIGKADPKDPATRRELAGILGLLGQQKRAMELFAGLELTPADRLNLAGLYASAENFDAAEKEYRAILADTPDDPVVTRQLAELLSWTKQYPESIKLFEKLLAKSPKDRDLQTRLAEVVLWSGDYAGAAERLSPLLKDGMANLELITAFTSAVANSNPVQPAYERMVLDFSKLPQVRDSKDPMFLANMAWVLHRAADAAGATRSIDAALALDPSDPATRKNLAGVLEVMGRNREAVAMFEGLVLTEGDRFRLAGLYSADKRYDLAEEQCRAILTESPNNPKARRLLANVLSWNGEYDQSLTLFQQLRTEFPNDASLPVRIAEVTLWDRKYDAAAEQFRTLLAANPDRPALWPAYIDALASADRITSADEELAQVIAQRTRKVSPEFAAEMYPNTAKLEQLPSIFLSRLAWVLFRAGDRGTVNEILDKVLARPLIEPEARRELAGVLSAAGRFREAIAMFNTTTLDAADQVRLAELHIATNDFATAELKLRELIRKDPNDISLKLLLSDVLIWTRQYPEALRVLEQARKQRPNDPAVLGRFATASVWNNNPETALEILQPLLEKDPDQPKLWQPYLDAVAAVKRVDPKYRETIEAVVSRMEANVPTDSAEISRYVTLGMALGRIGQGDRALRIMSIAVAKDPKNQQLRLQYAQLLSALGRTTEAEAQFRILKPKLLRSSPVRAP